MAGHTKAWVIRTAGGSERLQPEDIETPKPRAGWTLIRVRAFGLNRSEWFTRIGESPTVEFPRVLGIERVGEVVDPGGLNLEIGTALAAIMGGMGRAFDGSYADYTPVPHDIPTAVKLTSYSGEAADLTPRQLQEYIDAVEGGELKIETGPVFEFEDLVEAHRLMDANRAGGKVVGRGKH